MAAHRKPRKHLVSFAGLGALCALAAAAVCGFAVVGSSNGAPKAETLDRAWAASIEHVTAFACMKAGTVTGVSASVPKCPAPSVPVHLAAESGAAAASDRDVTLYACLKSETLTGVSTRAPECPADSVQIHWTAQSGPVSAQSSLPRRVASASPTPTPSSPVRSSPSSRASSSSAPSTPPAPVPSTSAPATVASPGSMTDCTTNQNGGANNNVTELADDTYHLQANEWNSGSTFKVCTNGDADFTISSSGIDVAHNGAPGAYPSLYKGCHWGNCTENSGMPVPVSVMASTPGKVTTSYSTTTVNSGAWDDSYDIWYNPAASTNSNSSGLEMMIWLNHFGGIQPAGSQGPTVTLDGISFTVWYGGSGNGGTVSFVANSPRSSVSNLDLGPLAAYAVSKGYMQNSWYLIDVEAGFEPWTSGQGLTANSFSVTVN